MLVALLLENPELVAEARVAERRPQEEPIELRLGERERALVLDRVLRRDEEERRRELPRHPVDGHLELGHRLEERGLCLRRRAVDLVDEDDVREDRARSELEVARLLVEHGHAGDVRRLEVGCALDARGSGAFDRARDRTREHRLRRPRHVLEEHVPAARERRQDELDLLPLAVDDVLDVVEEARRDRARPSEALGVTLALDDGGLHRRDGSWGHLGNRHRHRAQLLLRRERTLVSRREAQRMLGRP
jgi:hypothetical protein